MVTGFMDAFFCILEKKWGARENESRRLLQIMMLRDEME